eukprot:2114096-Amphidinium_carterae.3
MALWQCEAEQRLWQPPCTTHRGNVCLLGGLQQSALRRPNGVGLRGRTRHVVALRGRHSTFCRLSSECEKKQCAACGGAVVPQLKATAWAEVGMCLLTGSPDLRKRC